MFSPSRSHLFLLVPALLLCSVWVAGCSDVMWLLGMQPTPSASTAKPRRVPFPTPSDATDIDFVELEPRGMTCYKSYGTYGTFTTTKASLSRWMRDVDAKPLNAKYRKNVWSGPALRFWPPNERATISSAWIDDLATFVHVLPLDGGRVQVWLQISGCRSA